MTNPSLEGFAVGRFRGIGDTPIRIKKFSKLNFFIGQNNAGKSTILIAMYKLLKLHGSRAHRFHDINIDQWDRPDGGGGAPFIEVAVSKEAVINSIDSQNPNKAVLDRIVDFVASEGYIWLSGSVENDHGLGISCGEPSKFTEIADEQAFARLSGSLTGKSSDFESNINGVLRYIVNGIDVEVPPVRFIPAFRNPQSDTEIFDTSDLSGKGIISELADLQNPSNLREFDIKTAKFNRINGFLRNLTSDSSARISIPSNRGNIFVSLNGRMLPLANLGTGIHQTLLLASYCTIFDGDLMCIEEPELHLHPGLQKRLIKYISENTNNQYFIATHSPSFIDTEGSSIYHVRLQDGFTEVSSVTLDQEKFNVCQDLGLRASDIVQSNFVIWVEGPSERIYIRRWISIEFPALVENIHYTFMFYGGRNLSHVSADQDLFCDDFIKLRFLNRNIAIVMDSDKRHARTRLNSTKIRIQGEIKQFGGFVWITKGREIENYVDKAIIDQCLKKIHPQIFVRPMHCDQFGVAYQFERRGKSMQDLQPFAGADKVRLAREVVLQDLSLEILDLKEKIRALGELIQKANREFD